MIGTLFGEVGKTITLRGCASDYDRVIRGIQFSLDGGECWTTYKTPGTSSDRNVNWTFQYKPETTGVYHLLIRSLNERDEASPEPESVTIIVS